MSSMSMNYRDAYHVATHREKKDNLTKTSISPFNVELSLEFSSIRKVKAGLKFKIYEF